MVEHPVWLQLLYKLPSDSSTLRVHVWRRLRMFGGLYLQNSVCILPEREDLKIGLEQLRDEIKDRQGSADLIRIRLVDQAENARMFTLFHEQSDQEYNEFLGQCRDFHTELAHEREVKNLTFAELEENEMELGKLLSWLPKIKARDFFDAPLSETATRSLAECERDFGRFSSEVGDAQGVSIGDREESTEIPSGEGSRVKSVKKTARKKK
jgi:hypothetical protein